MTPDEIQAALREPFDPSKLGWKPQSVKGNRAMACCYIDARDVMDRLDEAVGLGNWQDDYDLMPEGSVVCRLKVRIDGEWVTKSDVGSPSEQPDGGDRLKAAFSDALKRAAVKYGIGRYLYSLPSVWCDYDPQKKQFTQTPQLPFWAIPKGANQKQQATSPAQQQQAQPAKPQQSPAKTPTELWERMGKGTPKTGAELYDWLEKIEASLIQLGTPSNRVFDGVMSFLKLGSDLDIKGVANAKDIEGAWQNAKNFVKLQADLTTAKA